MKSMKNLMKVCSSLVVTVLVLSACSETTEGIPQNTPAATGAYILSEGSFSVSSKLGFYDISTNQLTGNYYGQQNGGAELGQFANDIVKHGGKIYIVVNGSNAVVVLDAVTGVQVKRIEFTNAANGQYPRFALALRDKIYVSCQTNKIAIIDTATLTVSASIPTGSNPEQMALSGEKIFVANSGGFNYPNYDSTVSIISTASNAEIKRLKVGLNPVNVVSDKSGNVFVACYGNYWNIKPSLVRIEAAVDVVSAKIDSAAGRMAYHDGKLFVAANGKVSVYNGLTLQLVQNNFVTDGTVLTTPYGVYADDNNGNIWVTDAKDYVGSGQVYVFSAQGIKLKSFSASPGVNPNTVLFKR